MTQISFEFSDLIAGYVTAFDWQQEVFGLKTSDGREFQVKLTATTFAELLRNLGEAFIDCTGQMKDMLAPGRFLFVYGIFYPEEGKPVEAKHIVFVGRAENEYEFEKQNWWIHQIRKLADFYIRDQFGDGEIDYRNYRTQLSLYGTKTGDYRQETDTISRLVYGFASAYLLTGEERYLEAADKGTRYLREHFRATDATKDICYWYHAIDVAGDRERKVLASEFGDDYDALPCYEQIYALAGPVQTYRITGDPGILEDARRTMNLFDRYYLDHDKGGYFSHIDPITFSGRSETLGRNRSRKNWNSVGDHAPAYLINLYLATGAKPCADMLAYCADLIAQHFPDYEHSAFVQEKFHDDWSRDQTWGWQQNRAVVGHNLKIAWNLTRIYNLKPEDGYIGLAERIAGVMPEHGMDKQRGGWYDVVERVLGPGETVHRFAWHDRKAWWQQEQGILAYLILAGTRKDDQYLRHAREGSAFYNAWFLDQEAGGVYFNVLANGLPYLMGTERQKGSHSMSGYHSFELCYLAAVYTNLLLTKEAMDFYFRPQPGAFQDNILRVAPDILPPGSVRIDSVTVDGEDYTAFDADALTVTLPPSKSPLSVRVRITPTTGIEHFNARTEISGDSAVVTVSGDLDMRALTDFRAALDRVIAAQPERLSIEMRGLDSMAPEGARELALARAKLGLDEEVIVVGANAQVKQLLGADEFAEAVTFED